MTSFHLQIVGVAWQGFKALYEYSINESQALDVAAGGNGAARKYADDFEAVTDCRVVRCDSDYESLPGGIARRTDTYRTLRGFRNGMTPRRFHRQINWY